VLLQRNAIARRLVKQVGIELLDLYEYVERFCNKGQLSQHGNYTKCAIQSSGLHFFTTSPQPSGQQYTGLAIANAAVRGIPVRKRISFAMPCVMLIMIILPRQARDKHREKRSKTDAFLAGIGARPQP
jgi:hypothetical protein